MADLGVIVPDRAVLGATVIPEGDGFLFPYEATLEFRRGDVFVQHLQLCIAFIGRKSVHPGRKILVHE